MDNEEAPTQEEITFAEDELYIQEHEAEIEENS